MRKALLLAFAGASWAAASQITATESMDPAFTITSSGSVGSLSISDLATAGITFNTGTTSGPTLNITFSGGSGPSDYTLTAHADDVDDAEVGAFVDAISDTIAIDVSGGTVDVKIDPSLNFSLSMAGPTLATESLFIAVEEFDSVTSQWNALSSLTVHQTTTESSPTTLLCTNCVSADTSLTDASASFRVHTRLDYSIENAAPVTTPEPGTFGLLGTAFAAVVGIARFRVKAALPRTGSRAARAELPAATRAYR